MNFEEFKRKLVQIKVAISEQGKLYTNVQVVGNYIQYSRESGSREQINIYELFEVYNKESFINTTILRNYITGRKFSPSLAFLKTAGFYDSRGNRIHNPKASVYENNTNKTTVTNIGDSVNNRSHKLEPIAQSISQYLEKKFKKPARYIVEYSPGWLTAVPDKDILIDHWALVKNVYASLMDNKFDLDKQLKLVKKTGKQYYDIWFDDPYFFALEFDEEQHFNQFRGRTLAFYSDFDCGINLKDYKNYCNVEKKPGTSGFQKLKSHDVLFPEMLPGEKQDNRIRQRAFRDFLKDILPVANDYCPTVRIPFQLVNKKKGFNQSDLQKIVNYINRNDFIE